MARRAFLRRWALALAATLAVGSALLTTPAWAQGSGHLAGGGSEFTLTGVACTGPSSCVAVGDYANSTGASEPLSQRWNGTKWIELTIHGPRYSGLQAVSCPAASECLAVGFSRYGTLAESWNGKAWTRVPSPAPAGAIETTLLSVSCPDPRSCSAVGYYLNGKSTWLTLTETWNGSKWSLAPSPDPSGVTGSELAGVSCAQANSCVAVGDSFNSTGNSATLAERWNGTSWSIAASPNSSSGSEDVLTGASCVSASHCTAVGDYAALNGTSPPLIESLNGTSWKLVAGATGNGELDSIDCTGGSACMAVGSYAEYQTSAGWKHYAVVTPKGTYGAVLASVSCPAASKCMAVGFSTGDASDTSYNLSETWNGSSWALLPTPIIAPNCRCRVSG
jgi:hypothetical protein